MAIPVAGKLYYELDGQLLEIKRQLRQPAGYPFDPTQLKVALQNAIEGKFGEMRKQSLLSAVATTNLGPVAGKSTKDCFPRPRYAYRDADFDNWLHANQPNADPCAIATLALSREWAFAESAAAVLGIGAGTDVLLLGKLLIEQGHTMTLAQAEEMVEKTERGEKTEISTDGYGNFFFVETGNPKDPVSVGYVLRDERDWNARVDRLGHDIRCYADSRLLVRNLSDASKLGL